MADSKNSNKDDITKAVESLDIFMKNWCMDCAKTEKQNDLIFKCGVCEFQKENGNCLIKMFAHNHESDYDMNRFGSMVH